MLPGRQDSAEEGDEQPGNEESGKSASRTRGGKSAFFSEAARGSFLGQHLPSIAGDGQPRSVVGSMIFRTSVILVAGKPLISACRRMTSSSLAR